MKTKVQNLREQRGMTQSDLAEVAGLSLRTVQRIEAGNIPKGYTLKALSKALGIEPEALLQNSEESDYLSWAKLINISVLTSFVIPFGNLIFPSILTYKSRDPRAIKIGKDILSFQIVYSILLGILLLSCPWLMKMFEMKVSLFLIVLALMKGLNLVATVKNAMSLTKNHQLFIRLNSSML